MKSNFLLLCISLVFLSPMLRASVIPSNLNEEERVGVLKNLGFGAAMKLLTDPYPMGGFSGFELGINLNPIATKDFKDFGDKSAGGKTLVYPQMKIGKGLYDNLDLFANFSLYGGGNRVGAYGGMIRWTFYESQELPIHLSVHLHTMNVNFFNQLTGDVSGMLVSLGLNLENSSYYIGLGKLKATASFSGGFSGVTSSGSDEKEGVEESQMLIGVVRHFSPYFVAAEMNRYGISNFSLSAGLRF